MISPLGRRLLSRNRSTHLPDDLWRGVQLTRGVRLDSPPFTTARTIISRPLGVKGAFLCVSIWLPTNHRGLATSAFTVTAEWTTS
jgi:hypothetical protein